MLRSMVPTEHPLYGPLAQIELLLNTGECDVDGLTSALNMAREMISNVKYYHNIEAYGILVLETFHTLFDDTNMVWVMLTCGQGSEFSKRRPNFPKSTTERLYQWLAKNSADPYPTDCEKRKFSDQLGMSMKQINNWFINARRRSKCNSC